MSSSFAQGIPAHGAGHSALQSQPPSLWAGAGHGHADGDKPVACISEEGASAAPAGPRPSISVADWDVMFDAVRSRLIQSVGERLGEMPDVPQHSAELSASLVQAVVLDCVSALDQLHAALQQERSQRPTP